jgi:pectate lyase
MIGRRAIVGVSLLSALLFCAFAAQSASAAAAKNTTVVTCKPGNPVGWGFTDAHCTKPTTGPAVQFYHLVDLPPIVVTVTNAKTANETTEAAPTILKGTVFGVKNEITCKTVAGEGSLTNSEPVSKEHRLTGTVTVKFTSCTVNKPSGFGCKVKEPITVKSNVEGVEGLGAGKNEMGLEFKPTEGEVFNEITIEGCFIAGTFKTTGTAIGTGSPAPTEKFSGTTNIFTNAMTKETLKLAGNPAELSSSATVQGASGTDPVALETTT